MKSEQKCWLLLEKSDETRISKSFSSYNDKTGEEYNYDSLVPNYKNLRTGDLVILRKENSILGYGVVGDIKDAEAVKNHSRCPQPECKSTDIRERKKLFPKWKCGRCGHVFSKPSQTQVHVREYKAAIKSFVYFENPPSVKSVKNCAVGGAVSSQLSMIDLDPMALQTVLEGVNLPPARAESLSSSPGQGIGLSTAERKAVELHAMEIAAAHYKDMGWDVVDKSASRPFDILAIKEGQQRFIEVKGTTGDGLHVLLTRGEVLYAREHAEESVLLVVAHILLSQMDNKWVASGGKIICHEFPWFIDEQALQPTQYRYSLPLKV